VRGEGATYTAAISAQVSVRLWAGARDDLLWHGQTRGEPVFLGSSATVLKDSGDSDNAALRYSFSAAQVNKKNTGRAKETGTASWVLTVLASAFSAT
jgi:hypothetical protein